MLEPKSEPPSGNLTCPNLWNTLYSQSYRVYQVFGHFNFQLRTKVPQNMLFTSKVDKCDPKRVILHLFPRFNLNLWYTWSQTVSFTSLADIDPLIVIKLGQSTITLKSNLPWSKMQEMYMASKKNCLSFVTITFLILQICLK